MVNTNLLTHHCCMSVLGPEWHRELSADFTLCLQTVFTPCKMDNSAHSHAVGGSPAYRLPNTFSWQLFCRRMFSDLRHTKVIPGTTVGIWFFKCRRHFGRIFNKLNLNEVWFKLFKAQYSQLFPSGEQSASLDYFVSMGLLPSLSSSLFYTLIVSLRSPYENLNFSVIRISFSSADLSLTCYLGILISHTQLSECNCKAYGSGPAHPCLITFYTLDMYF